MLIQGFPLIFKAHIGRRVHLGFENPFVAFSLALGTWLTSEDLQFPATVHSVVWTDGLEESSPFEVRPKPQTVNPFVLQTRSPKPKGAQWLPQAHQARKWQNSSALSLSPLFLILDHSACSGFFNGKQTACYPNCCWEMGINITIRAIPPRDFTGGPVVKNPPFDTEDAVWPLGTNIPHIVEQLSPHVATTEAQAPQLESLCTRMKEPTCHN